MTLGLRLGAAACVVGDAFEHKALQRLWQQLLLTGIMVLFATVAGAQTDSTRRRVDEESRALDAATRSALAATAAGSRTIDRGSRVDGSVLVRDGTLRIAGEINGDAIVQNGDLVVVDGARVRGDAIAFNGTVRVDGGIVEGQIRSLRGATTATPVLTDSGARTRAALVAVGGVFAVILIVGIVTLILAEAPLLGVARAAARDISRSFWVGMLWQFLAVPLLCVGVAVCAITLIGIVVIPFVVIAWLLMYVGALTLGLLAISYLIGRAIGGRGKSTSTRSIEVRSLTIGVLVLGVVWLVSALLVSIPFVGVFARIVALALTWVAATVGMGAVVRSRGGRRVEDREPTSETAVPLWQTPTPVVGVVAAVKPVATSHMDV